MSTTVNRRDTGPGGETYGRGGGIGQFILVALVTLLLLAGVIYSAFQLGSRGSGEGPRVVSAPSTPVKVEPADPGGTVVADTGRQVYETIDGTGGAGTVAVAPAPERPVAALTPRAPVANGTDRQIREEVTDLSTIPPRVILDNEPDPAPDGPPERQLDQVASNPIETEELGPVGAASAGVSYSDVLTQGGTETEVAAGAAAPAAPPAAQEPAEPLTAQQVVAALAQTPLPRTNPRRPDRTAQATATTGGTRAPARPNEPPAATTVLGSSVIGTVPATTAAPAPAPAQSGPSFEVQLAALGSVAEAEQRWQTLGPSAPDLFSQVQGYRVEPTNTANGVRYRLRVGPFTTRQQANGFCRALQSRGIDCYATRR